ncbi:MAG: hypothetical protein ABIA93_04145 [Candidatus Woesearchaeota archaeon]
MKHNNTTTGISLSILVVVLAGALAALAGATPQGPDITYIGNSSADNSVPANRSDAGAAIHTITMNLDQQDANWKGYIGNITGTLTLDDANDDTIYNWAFASMTGEIFITRSSSTTFSGMKCANGTTIGTEQTSMGFSSTDIDNINNTFDQAQHASFLVGTTNITQSSCQALYTYVDDASQGAGTSNDFTSVLLQDDASNLIYTTIIADDSDGYQSNDNSFDFQTIVAQNKSTTTPTQYFFWVELG